MNKISLDEILEKQTEFKKHLVRLRIEHEKEEDLDTCHNLQDEMDRLKAKIYTLDWVISILK